MGRGIGVGDMSGDVTDDAAGNAGGDDVFEEAIAEELQIIAPKNCYYIRHTDFYRQYSNLPICLKLHPPSARVMVHWKFLPRWLRSWTQPRSSWAWGRSRGQRETVALCAGPIERDSITGRDG